MTGKLTIEYHAGNPNLCRIPELAIRSMPECEGGGWYMPREQAEELVAALASEPVAGTETYLSSWVVIRDPGCVPDLKGPFPHNHLAGFLREAFEHRQQSFVEVVTVHGPRITVQDGPEALEVIDGRSAPIARAHRKRLGATVPPHAGATTASALVTAFRQIIAEEWQYVVKSFDLKPGSPAEFITARIINRLTDLYVVATPPTLGAADRAEQAAVDFCAWLRGYFAGSLGKDELSAFEANTIRNTLNMVPLSAPANTGETGR